MIRLIVFCCLVAVALTADNESCNYKGNLYKKGDRFMDDCNRCFCGRNGMVGCTKMMCLPRHGGKATPMEAEKDSCNYKGKTYQKGDSFMDDCNHCFCGGNDMVGCTKMLCLPHETPMSLEAEKDSCNYKGKTYQKGDSFMDDCNHCFCGGNDMVGCTKMLCLPHETPMSLEAEKDSCNYKGKTYQKGDSFMDDCNHCFCGGNDMVGCTKMLCLPHETPMSLEAEKDSCNYKGKTYQKGDSFMDDCNHCFCGGNDMVGCTKMLCLPHETPMSLEENSGDCMFNGKVYKQGESFKKECNTCFCGGNGVIGCTLMMCKPKHPDANPYKITTCEHKGKTYKYGEHFMDDCNKCFCGVNGHAGCTQMMCIHPEDLPYADSETCTRDGKVYKKGDNFSLDGCNRCFCGGNNVIGCTKRLCPPKGCYHDGKFFKVGESYKNDCNRCICTKRGGACTKMACHH